MLTCSCDFAGDEWWYFGPDGFTTLETSKRKRCASCKKLIDISSVCAEFKRYRSPYNDIEERIWGDEVQLAHQYLCEWCAEMYFNFEALGYCYRLGDSMVENLKDYWGLTGFTPANKALEPDGQKDGHRSA